jgi:hypothetical protein
MRSAYGRKISTEAAPREPVSTCEDIDTVVRFETSPFWRVEG